MGDRQADEKTGLQDARRHEEPRFGFAYQVPRRFLELGDTVDPVARAMRHLDDEPGAGEAPAGARARVAHPRGYCDPAILGEVAGGRLEPLRLLEVDVFLSEEPLAAEDALSFQAGMLEVMPSELEASALPGYRFLGVRDAVLGPLEALAFEYCWDGASPGAHGGDRGLLLWALSPRAVFHVYHHCPADLWEACLPELEQILASFELLQEG